ncbi:MAG: FTR1 family protein [Gammaproteobacteria bacterium]|nr:FTR1 family protein [Gammaproteobacteria bacterium]
MLLSSVIIILREVLEAALLFSILIALSKQLVFNQQWIGWSAFFGIIGSIVYAMNIYTVSEWFEGVGQEVSNALMQVCTYFMLVLYLLLLIRFINQQTISKPVLVFLMIAISSLAITREGSEIILYFFSVTRSESHFMAVLMGMTIGASIGISIGLLFYYLLTNLKPEWSISLGLFLLILIASGMVSQSSLLLIQADWLPSQLPLWDVSGWLPEHSVIGQLLYALIGYEATPTAIQFGLYFMSIVFPVILLTVLHIHYKRKNNTQSPDLQEK